VVVGVQVNNPGRLFPLIPLQQAQGAHLDGKTVEIGRISGSL
jgi:hypothetical protein